MTLAVGDKAPAFAAQDQDGKMRALKDYSGKWLLLYFYPRDNTPGCTTEACAIRDNFATFEKFGAAVLGVSTDTADSHKKFGEKHRLPFSLLADPDKKIVQEYGAWGAKKFMGKTYHGTHRTSFLIGPDGKIARIYEKVKPAHHAKEVLEDIAELSKA